MKELKARVVLNDLKKALNELRDDLPEQDWRIKWLGICTLARSVGYVLEKIDAKNFGIEDFVKNQWITIKKEDIFSQFIEKNRNLILKQYEFSMQREPVGIGGIITQAGDRLVTTQDFNVLKGTFFKDSLPKESMEEVCQWWDKKLNTVEEFIKNKN
ncbi:MAG: hypothetical protein KDD46_06530 [Bdellovibrionales bacterium]|nr:hypothetical protein [Bdellovibrionales bacterium]